MPHNSDGKITCKDKALDWYYLNLRVEGYLVLVPNPENYHPGNPSLGCLSLRRGRQRTGYTRCIICAGVKLIHTGRKCIKTRHKPHEAI
jgi:hypothetical protein